MVEYLRDGPHGYCQRCAQKRYLSELQPDGYNPQLRVCAECYEEDNPQRYPVYIPAGESVLPYTLPPNECCHETVTLGGHTDLATLSIITPEPFMLLSGKVEVTT